MGDSVGTRFAQALAAKDADGLRRVLAPAVDFKALTPGKFWEATDADELVEQVLLGTWFEPTDEIEALERVETDVVGGRERVGYRLRVRNGDGAHAVEQQAYYETDGERISWLRVLCSGYQQIS